MDKHGTSTVGHCSIFNRLMKRLRSGQTEAPASAPYQAHGPMGESKSIVEVTEALLQQVGRNK